MTPLAKLCAAPELASKVEKVDASPSGAPAAPVSYFSSAHFASTIPLTTRTGLPASAALF